MVPARRRIGLGLLAVAIPLAAGCTDLGDPASAQGVARNDLVGELAAQLAGSGSLTYSATYQLAGGATATMAQAQNPLRTAYRYPGGEVLVNTAAITLCAAQTCTVTAPATTPEASVLAAARKAGLITPAAVEELLNTARIDPDVVVQQHDTTVAGRHATCLTLDNVDEPAAPQVGAPPTGAAPTRATPADTLPTDAAQARAGQADTDESQSGTYSVCITSDGVVGSFTGTLLGSKIDMALTDYADRVAGDAFDPPPAAKHADHRNP